MDYSNSFIQRICYDGIIVPVPVERLENGASMGAHIPTSGVRATACVVSSEFIFPYTTPCVFPFDSKALYLYESKETSECIFSLSSLSSWGLLF